MYCFDLYSIPSTNHSHYGTAEIGLCSVSGNRQARLRDAWIVEADTKIGYEVSFTRHFYKPPELRTLALEQETEGLLSEITKGTTA